MSAVGFCSGLISTICWSEIGAVGFINLSAIGMQVTVVGILTFKHITETHISVGIYDGTGTIEAKQYPDENVPVRQPSQTAFVLLFFF